MTQTERNGLLIRDRRKQMHLTQEALAQKLGVSQQAVYRWESGQSRPSEELRYVLEKLFGLTLDYVEIQDKRLAEVLRMTEDENLKETSPKAIEKLMDVVVDRKQLNEPILAALKVVDPHSAKTIVYHGVDEVVPAWEAYFNDHDNAVNSHPNDIDDAWALKNSFRVLIDRTTEEIIAIRDFGKYCPKFANLIFKTSFLPLYSNQPESADELESRAHETLNRFNSELNAMQDKCKKPIFLVAPIAYNDYVGWSLTDNRAVIVSEYKEYRDTFYVRDPQINSGVMFAAGPEYGIIPPTKALIDAIESPRDIPGLSPTVWSRKMPWDVWEPQPERKAILSPDTPFADTYYEAMRVINLGRSQNLGQDVALAYLEAATDRFERIVNVSGSGFLVNEFGNALKERLARVSL